MKIKPSILTINSGSSSIKFSLYNIMEDAEALCSSPGPGALSLEHGISLLRASVSMLHAPPLSGEVKGIGNKDGSLFAKQIKGETIASQRLDIPDHKEALKIILEWLKGVVPVENIIAVGHRLVHGGTKYKEPQVITDELISELRRLIPFAPEHLPHEIDAIKTINSFFPRMTQVACFDTAFHRNMPEIATRYALPGHLIDEGLLRYGFHGLSCEYILQKLAEIDKNALQSRIIIAHLGHGASMTAVLNGQGVETTMGFTPAGGLVMGSRSGDLDPGVMLYLFKYKGMSVDEVWEMVNHKSGLLGVSGISSSIKDLLEIEQRNSQAKEAVMLFCYQAKRFLASLVAVLGGLDTLIFTGGIGENSSVIRQRICDGLKFLGIQIEPTLNSQNAPVISENNSQVTVRVIKTNEELMIVRHTCKILERI